MGYQRYQKDPAMSDESRVLVLTVECERLRQENDRLRSENAALRPLVSDLSHKLALASNRCKVCEYHPTEVPITHRHEHG